jgi:tetratricopeptide (TPR) repeat protein
VALSGGPARRIAALAALLAALVAPALLADFKDAYKRGLDAIEQKRWDEAARQLRIAIAERPEAAGLLNAGTLFRRYTPHYWLGIALAEGGDCRGAVAAFETADKQGKLSKEEARELGQRRQACQGRIAKVGEAVAQAQREVDAAAAAAFQVAGVEGSPVMRAIWREGSPSFAARQEPATAQLASARSMLARADQELDADAATDAGRAAQAARRDLEELLGQATARRDQLQAEVQRELAGLTKAMEEARRNVSFVTRSLSPLPPTLARQCERVEEALTRAAAADLGTPLPDLRRLQDGLRASMRELRAAVKPPPDELQKAATAYLSGDYAAALDLLAAASYTEPRAIAHACLLRAAALHGLSVLQPRGGSEASARTREELRRCVALQDPVKPVPAAFPPSFLALYDEVAAEPRPSG